MLNTIAQIRLPNGEIIDMVDWTDLPLYSACDLMTGFTGQDVSLFQYTEGDPVPGLGTGAPAVVPRTATTRDTNASAPGSMATTEEMLVYAIKPEVYLRATTILNDFRTGAVVGGNALPGMPMPTLSALAVLQARLMVELDISEKTYAKASFGYFNTGFGPFGAGNTAPTSAALVSRNLGTNGQPSQSAVRSFVVPHHIGSQEKFRVNLLNPGGNVVNFGQDEATPPADNVNIMATIIINLDGLYKRPVS